jgi:hypothetical protein
MFIFKYRVIRTYKVREVLYKIIGTCTIYKVREVFCKDIYVLGICSRWFYVSIADLKYGVRFLHNPE